MKHILLSFVAIALLCSQANSACSGDFSTHTGPATYYGAYTGGGMCSLDPTPYAGTNGIYSTVAIASNYYSDSIACGMCLNVTSTQVGSPFFGSRLVYVNNKCPDCDKDLLDFGMNGDGKYTVSWTPVPCRVDDKTLEYKYQGSHSYYLKIQPRNTRYAVASVEILQGSTYKVLPRTPDYFFATPGSSVTFPLSFPLSLRITSTTGAVVIDSVAAEFSGNNIIEKVYSGANKVQFPLCGASGTAATTSSSTTTTTKSTSTTTTGKSTTTTTTTTGKSTTSSSTTTAKATTTTTTGSSSTTGSASFKYIFNDGFENSFQDWSWGHIANAQDTPAKSGSVSYSTILESWGAAYFACKGCIDTSKHSSIEFFIRSSVAIQSQFSFALILNDEEKNGKKISNYLAVNPSTANAWTKVTVPLGSGSGFSGVYDGLWVQETSNTGSTQPKLYIDEVKLFAK